jgi:hypothetical protein
MMGLSVHSGIQVYMHARRQCDGSFSEKKMPFYFNHPSDLIAGLRSQKNWEFKRF